MPVAVVVEVTAMPETMPMAMPVAMQVNMPVRKVDVPANVIKMQAVVMVRVADHGSGMADRGTGMTASTETTTAAAVRTRIGIGRDECRHANDGGSNESEDCRTFEHSYQPLGSMWAIRNIGRGTPAPGSSN